ncbi:MAG: hypothetical protein PHW53_04970 [Patescibacteria group bacterium]|nr:hypothetical protein [Patescibacteria group bacterium]
MTEIKRLETLLYVLHQNRISQHADPYFSDQERLEILELIHHYEVELEEAKLLAGLARPLKSL